MNSETTFQLIALALFAVLAAIGFSYRLRAAKAGDIILRREEGLSTMLLLRLCGFSMWLGLLTYLVNPRWMAWASVPLPLWARWLGAGIVLTGLPLTYWMFHSLGANVTDTVSIRRAHQLVLTGPYRWIRHPMYTFSAIVFAGFTLLTANWFIGVMGLAALAMLIVRTPVEEAKLIQKFGDEYRIYMARTGRYWPRLHTSAGEEHFG